MTTRPLYPHRRASTLPAGQQVGKPDYDLVAHLRTMRVNGDEAMTAVEQYDPHFSIKLSACMMADDAEALLAAWFERRVSVLLRTQEELRHAWQSARQDGRQSP